MKIYFDHAATSYVYDEVVDLMMDMMKNQYGNPSSTHSFGQQAKASIENSRKFISKSLGAQPPEIVFTSSGTEANNLIIRSAVEKLGVQRIITTLMEHKCVLETSMAMRKLHGVEVKFLAVDKEGFYSLEEIKDLLNDGTPTLVTLMHANNEVGNIYPIQEIATLVSGYENAFFHSDTVQTIGHLPIDFEAIGLDFASASAHKFHGPKGAGFAYVNKNTKLSPILYGGGQERNMRSGTENVYGITGMAKALEISLRQMEEDQQKIQALKEYTIQQLESNIEGVQFNGKSNDLEESLYTVLNVFIPNKDPMIGFQLDMNGIALSQGSACSSGAAKTSMVMSRLRTEEELTTHSPLRLSFSPKNTKDEIDYFIKVLQQILSKQKVAKTH